MGIAQFDAPKAGFHAPALTGNHLAARDCVAAARAAVDAAAHATVVTSDDEAEANAALRALLAGAVGYPVLPQVLRTRIHLAMRSLSMESSLVIINQYNRERECMNHSSDWLLV